MGSMVTIDLSDHFSDTDELEYDFDFEDSTLASDTLVGVSVQRNILTVEALQITADPVSIRVTADDTDNPTASQSFAVSVVSELDVEFPNSSNEIDNDISGFLVEIETEDIPRVEVARLVSQVYDITPVRTDGGDDLSMVSATCVCLLQGWLVLTVCRSTITGMILEGGSVCRVL